MLGGREQRALGWTDVELAGADLLNRREAPRRMKTEYEETILPESASEEFSPIYGAVAAPQIPPRPTHGGPGPHPASPLDGPNRCRCLYPCPQPSAPGFGLCPIMVANLQTEPRAGEWGTIAQSFALQSAVVYPIKRQETCFGLLVMASQTWGMTLSTGDLCLSGHCERSLGPRASPWGWPQQFSV